MPGSGFPWEKDSPEGRLRNVLHDYKRFLERGGQRGGEVDRYYRKRLSELVVEVRAARAKSERFTFEDELAAVEHIDVFG